MNLSDLSNKIAKLEDVALKVFSGAFISESGLYGISLFASPREMRGKPDLYININGDNVVRVYHSGHLVLGELLCRTYGDRGMGEFEVVKDYDE